MTGQMTFCHFVIVMLFSLLLLLVLKQQSAFLLTKIGLTVSILIILCPVYPTALGSTSLADLSWHGYSKQPGSEGNPRAVAKQPMQPVKSCPGKCKGLLCLAEAFSWACKQWGSSKATTGFLEFFSADTNST